MNGQNLQARAYAETQNLASYVDQINFFFASCIVTNKTCTAELDIRSSSTHVVECGNQQPHASVPHGGKSSKVKYQFKMKTQASWFQGNTWYPVLDST